MKCKFCNKESKTEFCNHTCRRLYIQNNNQSLDEAAWDNLQKWIKGKGVL